MRGGELAEEGGEADLAGVVELWSRKTSALCSSSAELISVTRAGSRSAVRSTPMISAPIRPPILRMSKLVLVVMRGFSVQEVMGSEISVG